MTDLLRIDTSPREEGSYSQAIQIEGTSTNTLKELAAKKDSLAIEIANVVEV